MFEESINPLILIVILYLVVQLAILVYFFFRKSSSRKCPSCGNPYGTRTKRGLFLKVFLFFIPNLKYYTCLNCGTKYFSTSIEKKEILTDKI